MPVPAGLLANLRGPLRVIRARRFCFSVSNTEHRLWKQPGRDTRERRGGSFRNCCDNTSRILGQVPKTGRYFGTGCGGDQRTGVPPIPNILGFWFTGGGWINTHRKYTNANKCQEMEQWESSLEFLL